MSDDTMPSRWKGLEIESEGTGISRPLSEQVNLLGAMLGEAIRRRYGDEAFERVETLRTLCKAAESGSDPDGRTRAAAIVAERSLDELRALLHAFASFFHLVNQAEKQEIVRINRERSRPGPRPESIREVIGGLHEAGVSFEELEELIEGLDIQPTFTAHPTEARPPAVLEKQGALSDLLLELSRTDPTPEERERILDGIDARIALLLATEDVRRERPTVQDEIEQGLHFLLGSVWDVVPAIHDDLVRAVEEVYGERIDPGPFLRYRSWIGSDRDGNPNVTAEVTQATLERQRRRVLGRYGRELGDLSRALSVSDRHVHVPDELLDELHRDAAGSGRGGEVLAERYAHEPFRLKIALMTDRVGRLHHGKAEVEYDADRFRED
ncbi:MAG: phosphoenolpyruvate carboxylase, partial [Gemmatimonadota bacterium]|nr:phosphoenolpyruvate carboxylase [Gemmatimonadota bacterium]